MTGVTIDHFGVPAGRHDVRVRDWSRSQAVDALAGHTVWCATARGRPKNDLRERLQLAGVAAGALEVAVDDRLSRLAERLERALRGAVPRLTPEERALFEE